MFEIVRSVGLWIKNPQNENYNIHHHICTKLVPMVDEITIDDFGKIELKTAKVIECEKVEKSRRLLRIVVDTGDERRQIISSISDYYDPDELIGKTLIVVANLKKAKIMGLESEGMLLAAERDDFLTLVTTDRESPAGMRIS